MLTALMIAFCFYSGFTITLMSVLIFNTFGHISATKSQTGAASVTRKPFQTSFHHMTVSSSQMQIFCTVKI